MRSKIATVAALALSLPPSPCSADGFKAIAKELARAADGAGIQRIAVLPFAAMDDGDPSGWAISEKLTTRLVRPGRVRAVERSLLGGLLEEQRLARTGLVDPALARRLGMLLAAEGLVTGSFLRVGRQVSVHARLIDVETGEIIAAVERRAPLDRPAGAPAAAALPAPAPEPFLAGSTGFRDAPADSCDGAPERVDRLEREILDVKARYWAIQLKNGTSLAGLKANPGSTISDPALKRAFYDRMRYWYALDSVPALTAAEVRRFVSIDEQAYSLYRDCGV